MTGPRRSHRKSRKGCVQCKRRRVKCDEREPRCNNCTKHGIECEFTARPITPGQDAGISSPSQHQDSGSAHEPSPLTQPAQEQALTPGPVASGPVASGPMAPGPVAPGLASQPPVRITWMQTYDFATDTSRLAGSTLRDLELMHLWSVETSLTLSNRQDLKRLWQVTIPREALSHEFLMRGILAISSLHQSHLHPQHRDSYIFTALSYQNVALKLVQSAMLEITRANCDAVFAFASLVIVFAFASPHFEESLILVEQTQEVTAEWVDLIRGVHSILEPSWGWIKTGKLSSLVLDDFEAQPALVSEESSARLDELQRVCEETTDGLEARTAYSKSMMQLKHCFIDSSPGEAKDEDRQLGMVFVWPAIVPEEYMTLLRRKRPEALVILAHYCIILHLVGGYWWLQGRAYCLVKNIYRMLDDSWRRWIEWPASVIELDKRDLS